MPGRVKALLAVFQEDVDPSFYSVVPPFQGSREPRGDGDEFPGDVRLGSSQLLLKRPFHEKYPPALG